jgi:hypothetical protein
MDIEVGATVRMQSGKTGLVTRQVANGRWVIRWLDSGNCMSYSAADIASRMTVWQSKRAVSVTASPAVSVRSYPKQSRCRNPRDCGDPTCNGSCGY